MRGPARRVAIAALLVATTVAGLLAAWFVSGWGDIASRQHAIARAPVDEASHRADELARELRATLAGIVARESDRPYFHYQNLFHDPRAGGSQNVTPSPLAGASPEPFVLGYFQREPDGRVTVPAINDDVPELSEPAHLAANTRFRAEVIRAIATPLAPVAVAASAQRVAIDPNTYLQNTNSTIVFHRQQQPAMAAAAIESTVAGPVTITVSAYQWRTLPYAGEPALVASRTIDTPDGRLVQGFVIDRSALTGWLADRAGPLVATLDTGLGDTATELAPGWHLAIAPNPRTLAAASDAAHALARSFLVRFAIAACVALIAGILVVWLVARAEALARERSQFAAAAAHELRTPLAGLQLYGDMLADGLGDPAKVPDYARRMSEEAARLGRVVSNVLGFSQLERGNLSVSARPDDLADALRELASRAEPALDRAGCALELDIPAALSASIDRDALARIVGNLLDNAEKYTRAASDRTITLAASKIGERVEVRVRDRGPGVARGAHLFAPFVRGTDRDAPAGLGLGLALSRSLARAMAGELHYRDAPDGGAELVLDLAG